MHKRLCLLFITIVALSFSPLDGLTNQKELLYVGTYASADSQSIYQYQIDTDSGALTPVSSVKAGLNPSYLTFDNNKRFVYAVNEDNNGLVSAFIVNPLNGKLTLLSQQKVTGGPCHVSVDRANKVVLVASYNSGSVAVFPIQQTGYLSPASDVKYHHGSSVDKDRQEGPHAHFVTMDPNNNFVFVVDLGIDKIMSYRLDVNQGKLNPIGAAFTTRPGSGPRHLAFHPNGKYAYLIQELSNTMTVLNYNSQQGTFSEIQTLSTLPQDFKDHSQAAAVKISADGRFLYGSNRGHNSIVVFSVDNNTGKLNVVQFMSTGGDWPRDLTLDKLNKFLIVSNERSSNVVTYRIDQSSGKISPTGKQIAVTSPTCVKVI